MEKESDVCIISRDVNGIRVPIGFRFRPTDEELILHYLIRKIYSFPFPPSLIPELDVFRTNPWDFPGELNEKKYFFSKIKNENNNNNNNNQRVVAAGGGCGYWKEVGNGKKEIVVNNQLVGMKKSMAFYQGKRPHGSTTPWVMHQLSLVLSPTQDSIVQVGEWVVCRIFQKKKKEKKKLRCIIEKDDAEAYLGSPTLLGSTCSSGITQISLTQSTIDEEISSHYCYNNNNNNLVSNSILN